MMSVKPNQTSILGWFRFLLQHNRSKLSLLEYSYQMGLLTAEEWFRLREKVLRKGLHAN